MQGGVDSIFDTTKKPPGAIKAERNRAEQFAVRSTVPSWSRVRQGNGGERWVTVGHISAGETT